VRTRCALTVKPPFGTILSTTAQLLLQTKYDVWRPLRTKEHRYYHSLRSGPHVHRYCYVPVPLFHYYALTLPWRKQFIAIPGKAIQEAEDRGELPDKLFILWAAERNARVLYKLIRNTHTRRHWSKEQKQLRRRIDAVKARRIALEQACIAAIFVPDWRIPRERRGRGSVRAGGASPPLGG